MKSQAKYLKKKPHDLTYACTAIFSPTRASFGHRIISLPTNRAWIVFVSWFETFHKMWCNGNEVNEKRYCNTISNNSNNDNYKNLDHNMITKYLTVINARIFFTWSECAKTTTVAYCMKTISICICSIFTAISPIFECIREVNGACLPCFSCLKIQYSININWADQIVIQRISKYFSRPYFYL